MSTDTSTLQKTALEFKSTSLNVPVLMLLTDNLNQLEHQLQEKIAQAPEFFKHSPLLIDLQAINERELTVDIDELINLLRKNHFLPMGIRAGNEEQNKRAIETYIPVHSKHVSISSESSSQKPEQIKQPAPPVEEKQAIENKFISHPIRSGQRIYARGDLIITAAVSAGAEIMAEGNIHVYGSLRGRALAGVQGNTDSRIFCSDLQAELISIAGNYKVSDEIEDSNHNHPVQIYLQDQALIIKSI